MTREPVTTLLQHKLYASYEASTSSLALADLALALLEQQKRSWRVLHDGYRAAGAARVRDIHCNGFSVRLQFNPQRLVSSGAPVDDKSIRERPCFLCVENLPGPQKGILYQDRFLILCNPMPIFAAHYTISTLVHVPQSIAGHVATFLALAKDFSPRFTVFYNGPKCGASAPDHAHFQASPAGIIPIEEEAAVESRRLLRGNVDGVDVLQVTNLGREVIVLEGGDQDAVEALLLQCVGAMQRAAATTDEPMLNIIGSYRNDLWRLIIFPRRKHRPDAYFREATAKILISPAAVDMGGLIVTPIEKDFLAVDAPMAEDIYREVSIDGHRVEQILSAVLLA